MPQPRLTEDWLALLLGGFLLAVCLGAVLTTDGPGAAPTNPLRPYIAAPAVWEASPADALAGKWLGIAGVGALTLSLFTAGVWFAGGAAAPFARGFVGVFALATLAYVVSRQSVIDRYGFAYMLWAILLGLVIANTTGAPGWVRPALRGELFTKVGLVLLGSQVLFGRLLELGVPGLAVSWVVTPVVMIGTYWVGRRVLRIESPSLSMVIAAELSVCGVSSAIATAAACRAKKEELSLAIGLSMLFTAVMMVAMPPVVLAMGLGPVVGGAWIGGTIDATGAVAAAGLALGEEALTVAATVKMVQNILVGVAALGVAAYWVTCVEPRGESGADGAGDRPTFSVGAAVAEVWRRFPKFILGFVGASVVFSLLGALHPRGATVVEQTIGGATNPLRDWCFCLAFTAIGLETDFRRLAGVLGRGKPLALYAIGQGLNLALSLAMAWLVFGVLFPPKADRAAGADARSGTPSGAPASRAGLDRAGVAPAAVFYTDHPRWPAALPVGQAPPPTTAAVGS